MPAGQRQGVPDRLAPRFQLCHHHVGAADRLLSRVDHLRSEPVVGAGIDHDAVLAGVVEDDEGQSGGHAIGLCDRADSDALGAP